MLTVTQPTDHFEPTAADLAEASYYHARAEYELRDFTVRCNSCGLVAVSPQLNLEKGGWKLSLTGEFCPSCLPPVPAGALVMRVTVDQPKAEASHV